MKFTKKKKPSEMETLIHMHTYKVFCNKRVNCLLIECSNCNFALDQYQYSVIFAWNYQSETYSEYFPFIEIDTVCELWKCFRIIAAEQLFIQAINALVFRCLCFPADMDQFHALVTAGSTAMTTNFKHFKDTDLSFSIYISVSLIVRN